MTAFEIVRNIFAVIGLIAVMSILGGLVFIRAYGLNELTPDEHADVKKGYPC